MKIFTKPLETERLLLKRGIAEDYYKVYEYDMTKLRDINNEFTYVKQDLSVIDRFITTADYNEDMADWIIYLKDNKPIGNIVVNRIVKDINAIEVAFNLHPNFWGKGYMKEACVEVMKYMFSLGFDNILCGYDEGNVKSAKINAKIGFKPYYEQKNAWYKNGIPITTYHNIMSKQDFDRLYLNDKNNQNDDVKTY